MLLAGLLASGLLIATDGIAQSGGSPAASAAVSAEPAQQTQQTRQAPSGGGAAVQTPVAAAATVDNGAGEFYGPVKPAESLWSIANRMRPNKQISTEQVLVAIYRSNPRAFYGSINSLNEGAVLRVPNIAEMTVLTAAEARVELRRLWSARPGAPAGAAQPLIDPLQIAPPPPASVDTRQLAPAEPAGETAAAATGDTPMPDSDAAAPPLAAPTPAVTAPVAVAAPVASSSAAASRSADLQARLGQLLGQLAVAISAAAATVSAALPAASSLDRLFELSFFGVLVLVLLLVLLRRLLAGPATPAAPAPLGAEPASLPVETPTAPASTAPPASAAAPFAAVLAAVAETAPAAPATAPPPSSPPPQGSIAEIVDPADTFLSDAAADADVDDAAGDPISTDEIGTKLDLARAYLEMDEKLLARVLLREVLQQGDASQRADAEALLNRVNQG